MSKAKWIASSVVVVGLLVLVCFCSFDPLVKFIDFGKTQQQITNEDELVEAREKVWKNPRDPNAKILFGKALRKYGDHDSALASFDQAISLEPKNIDAYIERGITHFTINRLDKAQADYEAAINIDPSNADVYGWYANVETSRANDFQRSNDLEACLEHLDKAIALQNKCQQFNKNGLLWRTNLGETEIEAASVAKILGRSPKKVRDRYLSGCEHLERGLNAGPIGEWNEKIPLSVRPYRTEFAIRICKLLVETYNNLSEKEKAAAVEMKLKELEAKPKRNSNENE